MKAKFKEKTYETYFQSELARFTNLSFAPDQTDEGILGFDGAFFIPYAKYPALFPYAGLGSAIDSQECRHPRSKTSATN